MGSCTTGESAQQQPEINFVDEDDDEVFSIPAIAFLEMDLNRDVCDSRDWVLNVAEHSKVRNVPLPKGVDLRPRESFPIYNQGTIGSCTANALAAAFHFEQWRQGVKAFCPSRLFIYYNERAVEGHISEDTGASLRDGIRVLHKFGVCPESSWPYDPAQFKEKPPQECYSAAEAYRCQKYARVDQTLESLKGCLAAGYPFVFGFQIFCDFMIGETQKTGTMAWPPRGAPHGGHAVQACGFDDEREVFIVRNSWGVGWGDQGHFYMPYKFMVHPQLCHDFWAILWVEGEEFPSRDGAAAVSAKMDAVIPSADVKAPMGGA
jgi:C1A family cysteine protease